MSAPFLTLVRDTVAFVLCCGVLCFLFLEIFAAMGAI